MSVFLIKKVAYDLGINMSSNNQQFVSIDKPQYSYLHALYRSFYSSSLYVDVAKRWPGFGITYLIFIVAILSMPFSYYYAKSTLENFNKNILPVISKVPQLVLKNGQFHCDCEMPYLIKNKEGKVALVIDTSGKKTVQEYHVKYPSLSVFVGKNSISSYVGTLPVNTKKYKVTDTDQFYGKQFVKSELVEKSLLMFKVFAFPIMASVVFGSELVILFLFAVIGQVVVKAIFKFDINYKQAVRLAMVASTPQLLLSFIFLNQFNLLIGTLLFLLLMGYFIFAALSYKKYAKQLVHV